jgi:hypothetical protein
VVHVDGDTGQVTIESKGSGTNGRHGDGAATATVSEPATNGDGRTKETVA